MLNFIKKIRNEKGVAAVEFALLLPILVVLVFGIMYFGPIYTDYIAISQAARDGARLLAVEAKFDSSGNISKTGQFTEALLRMNIIKNLPSYLTNPSIWGHLTGYDALIKHSNPDTIGAEASVIVFGDYVINIPLIPALSNKTIHISNEVFMRQER